MHTKTIQIHLPLSKTAALARIARQTNSQEGVPKDTPFVHRQFFVRSARIIREFSRDYKLIK